MKKRDKTPSFCVFFAVIALIASVFASLFSGGTVLAADCSSLYSQGSNEYTVCEEGFNNASDSNYCDKKYKNAKAYDSCVAGYKLGNNQPVTQPSTPANSNICQQKYGNDPDKNKIDTCNKAYNEATDETYCDQYKGRAAYDSCYVGQMAKLGKDTTPPSQSNQDIYNSSDIVTWCDNKYSDPNEQKACKEGAQNMGIMDYCEAYKGRAYYDPCKAGWDHMQEWAEKEGESINYTSANSTNPAANDQTCTIPYVGWAICPIMLAASAAIDQMYGVVESFLITPASIFTDAETNGIMHVYRQFLNIANVVLAIIFLIIILAEASGGILQNYTIKKVMPKLVLAAVFINIAFYICAAAVDITNVVGGALPEFFNSMESDPVNRESWQIGNFETGTGNWEGLTRTALLGAGIGAGVWLISGATWASIGWAVVLFLIPIIIGVLVAILAILLALTLRSVAIIIFIIISPLAFCAMILPNTNKWFTKWGGVFVKLLLLYPIIALVFGGSKLAGSIILNVAGENVFLLIAGSAATILPLIVVPSLLKGAVNALGTVGGKVSGLADKGWKASRTATDKRMKESAPGEHFTRQDNLRRSMLKAGIGRGKTRAAQKENSYRQSRAMAMASALADIDEKNMKGMTSYLEDWRTDDGNQLQNRDYMDIIMGNRTSVGNVRVNETMQLAAWDHIGKTAGGADMARLMNYVSTPEGGANKSQAFRNAAFNAFKAKGDKTAQVRARFIPAMQNGTFNNGEAVGSLINNALSDEKMVEWDVEVFRQARDYVDATGDAAMRTRLQDAITNVRLNNNFNGKIDSTKAEVFESIMTGNLALDTTWDPTNERYF
ncbi:MAG: hypothetical protein LBK50_00865 [Candidatus Nomurabacteria bacterium]|jgi:hypothetical protein|nr:hypothetical protein [Candidatus Nomurabacteria bacterium]